MAKRRRKHTRRHKRNPTLVHSVMMNWKYAALVAAAGVAIWYWKFRDEKPGV